MNKSILISAALVFSSGLFFTVNALTQKTFEEQITKSISDKAHKALDVFSHDMYVHQALLLSKGEKMEPGLHEIDVNDAAEDEGIDPNLLLIDSSLPEQDEEYINLIRIFVEKQKGDVKQKYNELMVDGIISVKEYKEEIHPLIRY